MLHSWKRSELDETFGNDKRIPSALGGSQLHSWKRSNEVFDNEKRIPSALGGSQLHSWKRSEENDGEQKRVPSALGDFQLHQWKKRSAEKVSVDVQESEKSELSDDKQKNSKS